MERREPPLTTALLCLAAIAGFVDALAFTAGGGLFAASMGANSTRLAADIATGTGVVAAVAASLVLSFVSGTILASVLLRAGAGRPRAAVAGAMAALLLLGAPVAGAAPALTLLLLATAMGMAHLLFHHEGGAAGGGAPLTGTLVALGSRLAAALTGDADRWGWVPHLLLWLCFAAGAVMGAVAAIGFGYRACWFAGLAAAVLAVWLARLERRATRVRGISI